MVDYSLTKRCCTVHNYVLCIAMGDKLKTKYDILQGALTEDLLVTGLKYCSSK